MGFLSSITPGLGSVLGGIGSSVLSGMFAKRQASKQMEFQKGQSDTAHQRQVRDMRSAGLNPILSATGGSGASTPTGAMATPDITASAKMGAMAIQELRQLSAQAGITENELAKSDVLTAPYKTIKNATNELVETTAQKIGGKTKEFLATGNSAKFISRKKPRKNYSADEERIRLKIKTRKNQRKNFPGGI